MLITQLGILMIFKVEMITTMDLIIIRKDTMVSSIMVQIKQEMLIHKWTILDSAKTCNRWEACFT